MDNSLFTIIKRLIPTQGNHTLHRGMLGHVTHFMSTMGYVRHQDHLESNLNSCPMGVMVFHHVLTLLPLFQFPNRRSFSFRIKDGEEIHCCRPAEQQVNKPLSL